MNIRIANRDNFYSRRLTGATAELYGRCLDALSHGAFTVTCDGAGINAEAAIEAVLYGCPELFFVTGSVQTQVSGDGVKLVFSSKYDDIENKWKKLDAEVERIAAKVRAIPKAYDKLYRINQYLCARVKGVNGTADRYGDAYGALILKEARCEGYCKAAQLIMSRCGIDSIIAVGEAERNGRIPHSWTIAYVDGTPYSFDFSWNASFTAYKIYGVDYMFLPDSEMLKEHFPKHEYPACTDDTQTFWARNNGFVRFRSDIGKVKVVPVGNSFTVVARLAEPLTEDELDYDVRDWMVNELNAYSYGKSAAFRYNEKLKLLVFSFINED